MENLQNLMRSLDDISKMIPEGTYLEMCDNLKEIHQNLPQHEDPPVTDNRRPLPVNVPFQVVIPGVASETDEWIQNERSIRRLTLDCKIVILRKR